MSAKIVTQKRLKELLHYCPETGDFTRLAYVSSNAKIGDIAGCLCHGYLVIMIDYRNYQAHRLAFLYMTGEWPTDKVDHDDHIRNNNRWSNLNQATYATNSKNQSMPRNNTSGVVGVCWFKQTSKWQASIRVNDKLRHLGRFTDIKDAIEARKAAEIKYGFHQNHGL